MSQQYLIHPDDSLQTIEWDIGISTLSSVFNFSPLHITFPRTVNLFNHSPVVRKLLEFLIFHLTIYCRCRIEIRLRPDKYFCEDKRKRYSIANSSSSDPARRYKDTMTINNHFVQREISVDFSMIFIFIFLLLLLLFFFMIVERVFLSYFMPTTILN